MSLPEFETHCLHTTARILTQLQSTKIQLLQLQELTITIGRDLQHLSLVVEEFVAGQKME